MHTVGKCRVGYDAIISRVGLHMWEEPIISGVKGSGTIFFAGCSLGCVYCQNYRISHSDYGKRYKIADIVDAIRILQDLGAHNINFVNPGHYAHIVEQVLQQYKPLVPVVYNSSGYDSVATLRRLQGLIDIYLPDCKYADPALARRYSHIADYPTVAQTAIEEMVRQQPNIEIQNGLMKKGVIIRHLVLPNASNDSVNILSQLYKKYGEQVYYSVMSQYTPYGEAAEYPEINRAIKPLEYKLAVGVLQRVGAKNVFVQDISASNTAYIPPFTGE